MVWINLIKEEIFNNIFRNQSTYLCLNYSNNFEIKLSSYEQ